MAGTAFFIAPDRLLTSAHVVRNLNEGDAVAVRFNGARLEGIILCKRPPAINTTLPFPDVAVIKLKNPTNAAPLQLGSYAPGPKAEFHVFGFPQNDNSGGEDAMPKYAGVRWEYDGSETYFIRLREDVIREGMSGAPVMLRDGSEVIGMVTDTMREDYGGHATPSQFLVQGCEELSDIDLNGPPPKVAADLLQVPEATPAQLSARDMQIQETPLRASLPGAQMAPEDHVSDAAFQEALQKSRALRRQGKPHAANAFILDAMHLPQFRDLRDVDRAAIIREAGITFLEVGDVGTAERFCQDAAGLDPSDARQIIFAAELVAARQGYDAALQTLPERSVPAVELFRASYLTAIHQPQEAVALIRQLPEDTQRAARTRRSLVLAYAALRDRDAMLTEANAAWEIRGDDAQVAFVVAYAYVLSGLASMHWPPFPWGWPQPIPVDPRISAEEKREPLRRAVETFHALGRDADTDEVRLLLEAWHFAALALSGEAQAAAVKTEAARMLSGDAPNYRILPWIWALELPIDTSEAVGALRRRLESGVASLEEVQLLTVERLDAHESGEALAILRNAKALFETSGESAMWHFMLVRVLLEVGDEAGAREQLSFLSAEQRFQAEMILTEAHRGDEAGTIPELMRKYAETKDPMQLLLAAELARRISDWAFLGDHGEELLKAFGTLTTARYAIYGAFNTARFDDTIDWIRLFEETGQPLPEDLLRIRARALERLGSADALAAYESLIAFSRSAQNLYVFAHYAMTVGDYALVRVIAQQLLLVPSTPDIDLSVAQLCRVEDPELSRTLWRRALKNGAPRDELVLAAYMLAHELGLGAEITPLQEPLLRLGRAGEHGIRLMEGLEALKKVVEDHRERTRAALDLYRKSVIPIHAVCEQTNVTIAVTHFIAPRANAKSRFNEGWEPIYVRHGARAIVPVVTADKSLYLDATSLLLAADMGLLDELRDRFGTILVAKTLVPLLGAYRERLEPGQPERVHALRRLLELVNNHEIEVSPEIPEELARVRSGVVVDWIGPNFKPGSVSPRRLIDSLHRDGLLTAAQYAAAIRALGNIQEDQGEDPPRANTVILTYNTAETLEEAGAIDALLATRKVIMQTIYLEHIRAELTKIDHDREAARWLTTLLTTLRAAHDAGWLRTVPSLQNDNVVGGTAEMIELGSLFSIMPDNALIIVDDRMVNAYSTRDGKQPILALSDLLYSLFAGGSITIDTFCARMIELRSRGLLFIPLLEEELIYHVQRSIVDDEFVPTRELRIIERYLAFAVLNREAMNGPSGPESPTQPQNNPQTAFIAQSGAALRATVSRLFRESPGFAFSLGTWLHDHFSMDGLPGYGIDGFGTPNPSAAIDVEGANYLFDYAVRARLGEHE